MKFFDDFNMEINLVLNDIYSFLGGLDKPISDLGVSFLDKFKVSLKGFNTFLLFPYWLAEGFDVKNKEEISRNLSNLNVYGIMHMRILDDLLDNPEKTDRNLLLISNICEFKSYEICFKLIGRNQNFLKDLQNILINFSNIMLLEKQNYLYNGILTKEMKNYNYKDMANKTIHLRVPILSYLYLEDSDVQKRNNLLSMMDCWGVSMQLFNDVLGWKDDFNSGQITYPLLKAIQYLEDQNLVDNGKIDIMDIAAAFIETDIIEASLDISLRYQKKAIDSIKKYNLFYLKEFFNDSSIKITSSIDTFKNKRENILKDIFN